jgi:hypothetical protein
MNKSAQADLIWRRLFCERSPLSEACRGVLTTLARLGLDPHESGLDGYRRWFAAAEPDGHVDRVMELAGIFSDGDEGSTHGVLLREVLLPLLAERGLPLAMMIGSTGAVNPGLGEAGHMVGRADIGSVTRLCADFPGNRFLVTLLSRENQYELAVLARKFRNLTIFGCWWYLNTPSLVREITRMRLELLGTGFIPQHSDARVLEQLVYKWEHSRAVIAGVLAEKYCDLAATGWPLTEKAIARDVQRLLCGNTAALLGGEADA